MGGRGPLHNNVASLGVGIPSYHLPPSLRYLARVPHLAEPQRKRTKRPLNVETIHQPSGAWSSRQKEHDTQKIASAKLNLIFLASGLFIRPVLIDHQLGAGTQLGDKAVNKAALMEFTIPVAMSGLGKPKLQPD